MTLVCGAAMPIAVAKKGTYVICCSSPLVSDLLHVMGAAQTCKKNLKKKAAAGKLLSSTEMHVSLICSWHICT
jgi:hypothetical protein